MPRREQDSGATYFTTERKKLGYAEEFKDFIREHPGAIKAALALTKQAVAEYNPGCATYGQLELEYDPAARKWLGQKHDVEGRPTAKVPFPSTFLHPSEPLRDAETGVEVTLLGVSNREITGTHFTRVDVGNYFKVNVGERSFFVKENFITTNPGFAQIKNTMEAKKALAGIDYVKVVEAQLGYQDEQKSWYVSKWDDLENAGFDPYKDLVTGADFVSNYGASVEGLNPYAAEYEEVKRKFETIRAKLAEVDLEADVEANLFYNRRTKQFLLIDVTNIGPEMLGRAIKS